MGWGSLTATRGIETLYVAATSLKPAANTLRSFRSQHCHSKEELELGEKSWEDKGAPVSKQVLQFNRNAKKRGATPKCTYGVIPPPSMQ